MSSQNDSSSLDCTRCGACCFSTNPDYVRLFPQDALRSLPDGTTHERDGERYLDMGCGRCSLLVLSPDGSTLCGVYENRPEACRAFRADSFECLMARKHKGAEAEAARLAAMAALPAFIAAEATPDPAAEPGLF